MSATRFIPPKPVGHPRKLNLFQRLFNSFHSAFSGLYENSYRMKLGEVRLPRRRMYFANQKDLVDRILTGSVHDYPKSDLMATMLELLMGQSIFVSNGALWEQQRRMMDPAFETTRIKAIFPLMVDAAEAMADRLRTGDGGPDTAIDLEMTHVTADVIFRTIYSRPFARAEAETIFTEFEQFQHMAWIHGVCSLAGLPKFLFVGKRKAKRHARIIRDLLAQPILARRAAIAQGQDVPEGDLLAAFIAARDPETGKMFNDEELIDQVAIMFLAGHETSASALAWTLYCIANDPDVQSRLHAEIDAAFAAGPLTFSRLRDLPFTRDVFREGLRLYPPVSFIPRDATRTEQMRDKTIAPGSILFFSPWLVHRHVDQWDDPDIFDPDRFDRPEGRKSMAESFLPFSKGPRVCLGASFALQEGVLVLATLLRDWAFSPVDGHVPIPISRLTLRSENGIRLNMVRRTR